MDGSFLVAAVIGLGLLVYFYVTRRYKYFAQRNVPFVKPMFLLGNGGPILLKKCDLFQNIQNIYDAYPQSKVVGMFDFLQPVLMVRDPDLIKLVAVKDFDHFVDRSPFFTGPDEVEAGGDSILPNVLIALRGQKWRHMRATLSPAFTGSKIRHMFPMVTDCAESIVGFMMADAKTDYDMKDVFSRYSNDVIASVAFGVQVDSFREPDNEFFVKGKGLLNFKKLSTMVKMLTYRFAPAVARRLKIEIFNAELLEAFKKMITDNMQQRESQGIVRNDMVHMLMQVRKGSWQQSTEQADTKDAGFATVEESTVGTKAHTRLWSDNELIAQCFLFFIGAFESISTALTFASYELLMNPEIQQKMYEEIVSTEESLDGKPLSYEVLQKMQYLDMVVSESLRRWPPNPFVDRYCVKEYVYDDGRGGEAKIEKGQIVWFPIIALHQDPQYYPDPYKFDPERFSEANRSKINPAAYLPFGVGPRNCIGSRLALLMVKSILFYLMKHCIFERSEKSTIPLKLVKTIMGPVPEGGVWLKLKPRN
ncbi:probable cytochrome P450 9f2 isoform X3 [Wyeomyia smithii]|uniref:probable cytochrome P450 9f2 isoform X3 n=1 Tax=Wyeomyia smithii TaxID=174621 RepID=UPI002467F33F|nr:probable cytochrome P450 9f2 isoform X3 [Wyeomyia smithii]XP_055529178.1 probable cytochrome P450 9f2 isoform X3 [Wyeomyia smithii]XP_055529179.1 probable cytochrome P450 9f2 isoform X3 [Wyeomyia smithii]